MPAIPVKQAKAGMILAVPVEDALGRVLINAGEELTEELILVLVRRGFHEVDVRPAHAMQAAGNSTDESTHPDYHAELKQIQQGIEQRFARFGDTALKRAAHKVLVARLNKRLGV